jgi:hypothetical protein
LKKENHTGKSDVAKIWIPITQQCDRKKIERIEKMEEK